MVDIFGLFKKDYRSEFKNRCSSKVEERIIKARESHGLEDAKVQENIRTSVCDLILNTNIELK